MTGASSTSGTASGQPTADGARLPEHDEVRRWCGLAVAGAEEKLGERPVVLAVGPLVSITEAFVITSAPNARQVRSITEEVELQIKEGGGPGPIRIEGLDDARWVLMDYGEFVVNVFLDEVRDFYDLEKLWADAERWTYPAKA